MREHVENWDAELDEYAHAPHRHDRIDHFDEPELVTWARGAPRSPQLVEVLRNAMHPPVLDDQ